MALPDGRGPQDSCQEFIGEQVKLRCAGLALSRDVRLMLAVWAIMLDDYACCFFDYACFYACFRQA